MSLLVNAIISVCFVVIATMPAKAADSNRTLKAVSKAPVASEAKVALVIGNSRYRDMPLKNPGNDARAMAAKLRTLGFQVVLKEDLGAMQIGSALRDFKNKLSPGAVALFYYAGHGLQVKGVNYLPAVDALIESEEDVPRGSLNVNEVLSLMEESKSRLNLVFLDACRNNPYARSFRSTAGGLAKLEAPSGTLISFATRPGSVAADGGGSNGIYTEQLLKAIDQPGMQVEQVLKQVTSLVKRASGGKQEPWMEGSIEGEFYFQQLQGDSKPTIAVRSEPAVSVPAQVNNEDIEREFWNRIKDSKNSADYETYLSEYPNGRYVALAKLEMKRYATSENKPRRFQAGDTWEYEAVDAKGIHSSGTLTILQATGDKATGNIKLIYTDKANKQTKVLQPVNIVSSGHELTMTGHDPVVLSGPGTYNPDNFFLRDLENTKIPFILFSYCKIGGTAI